MAIALVTHTAVAGNPSGATTGSINTTGANLIVFCIASYISSTLSISDSKGNTWSTLTRYWNAATENVSILIAYCYGPSVGSGHTFSVSGGSSYASIAVAAFSGAPASPLDQQNGSDASGSSSTVQPGSITPTQNNELIVSAVGIDGNGNTPTVDSSISITDTAAWSGGNNFGISLGYRVQSAAAAINPTWTLSGSSPGMAPAIASFKSAASPLFRRQFGFRSGTRQVA